MAAVTVIALILAGWLCLKRRAVFLERADFNRWQTQSSDVHGQRYVGGKAAINPTFFEADGTVKEEFARAFERQRKHHAALERKYRYAAAHPWLGVEPDPPEPQ